MLPFDYQVPRYLQHLLECSMVPTNPSEDITYPVISEFLLQHKLFSASRFTIYPQLRLLWKPERQSDQRSEVPDMGLVNFRLAPPFLFRVGVESKRVDWELMRTLPAPDTLENNENLMDRFHFLSLQAEDQAKAVVKNGHVPYNCTVPYLLFIGPYWTHQIFGPFNEAQLTVRNHKPSDSGDFYETLKAARRAEKQPTRRKLFLLGTVESALELEDIITSTDVFASATQQEAEQYW